MAYCKNCLVYSKTFDNLRADWQDTKPLDPDQHFCLMYPAGIPKNIWAKKEPCKLGIEENE